MTNSRECSFEIPFVAEDKIKEEFKLPETIEEMIEKNNKLKECNQLLEVIKNADGDSTFKAENSYVGFCVTGDWLRLNLWGEIKDVILSLLESYYFDKAEMYKQQIEELLKKYKNQ